MNPKLKLHLQNRMKWIMGAIFIWLSKQNGYNETEQFSKYVEKQPEYDMNFFLSFSLNIYDRVEEKSETNVTMLVDHIMLHYCLFVFCCLWKLMFKLSFKNDIDLIIHRISFYVLNRLQNWLQKIVRKIAFSLCIFFSSSITSLSNGKSNDLFFFRIFPKKRKRSPVTQSPSVFFLFSLFTVWPTYIIWISFFLLFISTMSLSVCFFHRFWYSGYQTEETKQKPKQKQNKN